MSGVLSTEDIAELRTAVSELFPDRADIFRRAPAEPGGAPGGDQWGGYVPSHPGEPVTGAADLRDVPVLYGTRSAAELARLAATGVDFEQTFTFPGGTDIRQTDQIHVNGEIWEVASVGGGGAWEVTIPVGARRAA